MKTQVLSQARSVFRQLYFALAEQLTQCPSRGVGPLSVLGSFCRCNDFMLISIIITSPASSANQQTLDTKTVYPVYFCTNTHMYFAKCSHDCVWGWWQFVGSDDLGWYKYRWRQFAWNGSLSLSWDLHRVLCRQCWSTFPGAAKVMMGIGPFIYSKSWLTQELASLQCTSEYWYSISFRQFIVKSLDLKVGPDAWD